LNSLFLLKAGIFGDGRKMFGFLTSLGLFTGKVIKFMLDKSAPSLLFLIK